MAGGVGRGCGGLGKVALPAMVDGRAEAGGDVDAPTYSLSPIEIWEVHAPRARHLHKL
jgi:hypothetical protein